MTEKNPHLKLPSSNREAVDRYGWFGTEIRVPMRNGDQYEKDLRHACIAKAVYFYHGWRGSDLMLAYRLLNADFKTAVEGTNHEIKKLKLSDFRWLVAESKPGSDIEPLLKVVDTRERYEHLYDEMLDEACELFLTARETGALIGGQVPRISMKCLEEIIPVLCRGVGMDRVYLKFPSPRKFRRWLFDYQRWRDEQ